MMMMDLNRKVNEEDEEDDDNDSERTESYTPPPLDMTIDLNPNEKENHHIACK